ncbi:MAG: hypothetical protein L3J04_03270 [Robiginitomaculum sp.]|nr:hypothetical protein [Robiginitomaculum sp.]
MKSAFEEIKQEMGKGPLVPIMLSVVFLGIPLLILLAGYNKDDAAKALLAPGIILAILLATGSLPFFGIYFHNLGKRWPEPVRKNKIKEKLRRSEVSGHALMFVLGFWVLAFGLFIFIYGIEAFYSKSITMTRFMYGLFLSNFLFLFSRMFIERWAWHLSVWKNKKFHRIGVRFRRRFKIKRRRRPHISQVKRNHRGSVFSVASAVGIAGLVYWPMNDNFRMPILLTLMFASIISAIVYKFWGRKYRIWLWFLKRKIKATISFAKT